MTKPLAGVERRRMGIAHAPDERYEQFVGKWATEIGRFILAFGSIEHTTYLGLRSLPRDPIGPALNKLLLADRIDVLLAVAGGREEDEAKKFFEVLTKVKAITNERNLVAHNGVGLDIYIDTNNFNFVQSVETIRSGRDANKHIELEQLRESRLRAEKLAKELHDVFVDLRRKIA